MVGACVAALAGSNRDLADLRIAMLEPRPPATPPPDDDVELRVSAISRASERILSAVDAWSRIPAKHRSAYSEMKVWDAQMKPHGAGSIHFSASASSEPNLGYIVENRRIQWALYDCPSFRRRVTVLSAELAALEFGQDQAIAVLADGRRISAALVVGADGAASAVASLRESRRQAKSTTSMRSSRTCAPSVPTSVRRGSGFSRPGRLRFSLSPTDAARSSGPRLQSTQPVWLRDRSRRRRSRSLRRSTTFLVGLRSPDLAAPFRCA